MNFFKFIRLTTWWFKLPPFLVLIYLYFIKENIKVLSQEIYFILFLLTGLIIGAIFASLINNYYDQEDDLMANKENLMVSLSKSQQFLALVSVILLGIVYSIFLLRNTYAFVFYWLGWVCFYIYSCKQFRLKEKTYFGIIFDGLGSQFFPTLFIFTFLYGDDIRNYLVFVISGSSWMLFSFGMRSLIIHQYNDFDNDIKAGVSTFVNSTSQLARSGFQIFVLLIEILSFIIFNWTINWHIFVLPMLIYVILLIVFKLIFKIEYYFFMPHQNQKSRSLFFDFYCTILPFTLLGLLTLKNNENCFLLIVSVLLFNVPTMFNAINFFKIKIR